MSMELIEVVLLLEEETLEVEEDVVDPLEGEYIVSCVGSLVT